MDAAPVKTTGETKRKLSLYWVLGIIDLDREVLFSSDTGSSASKREKGLIKIHSNMMPKTVR